MCTFTHFSGSAPRAHKIEIPLKIPTPPEFSQEPDTLGDHLRRRRLELGLYQKDVAARIGVTASTVWNWEHGMEPEIRYFPKIIDFLGYVPFDCPDDTVGKLAWFKKVNGLSCEKLGEVMGRDPEQLEAWLSGRIRPNRKNVDCIDTFLREALRPPQPESICRGEGKTWWRRMDENPRCKQKCR